MHSNARLLHLDQWPSQTTEAVVLTSIIHLGTLACQARTRHIMHSSTKAEAVPTDITHPETAVLQAPTHAMPSTIAELVAQAGITHPETAAFLTEITNTRN